MLNRLKVLIQFNAIFILFVFFYIKPLSATIQGIYRVSNYQIFDDGSFSYDVTIKVYNNINSEASFNGNCLFFTDDTTKIHVSRIKWSGPFKAFTGQDPFQQDVDRTGFQREFIVNVPALDSLIYKISYSGPSEYWSFGGGEGAFYGDGSGGANTAFKTFWVSLTLPQSAVSFSIIKQSSPYILLSSKPYKLRWIEHNVKGVACNLGFSGSNLTTSNPVITVTNVSPEMPTTESNITLEGFIKFPNGNPYVPAYGSFGVEDPLGAITSLIQVREDGSFSYATSNVGNSPGGFYDFKFCLNYENKILSNSFVLQIIEQEMSFDYFADIKYEMSLYNHTSNFPPTTDAFVYRSQYTPPPLLQTILDAGADAAIAQLNYSKAVFLDYWSSDVNKGILATTGIACASVLVPNPVSHAACAWGMKTVGIGLLKSVFFVTMDKIIDMVSNDQWTNEQKQQAKILVRETTHLVTFFLHDQAGGIKAIADAGVLAAKMTELTIQSVRVAHEENEHRIALGKYQGAQLDGFVLQCVDDKGDVWNIGVGRMQQNAVYFSSHSPVDLKVTDPIGRVVEKGFSEIPGSRYIERDLDGDGFTDDEIFIPEYILGNYNVDVVRESIAAPNDKYSVTMSGSWLDSTVIIADQQLIENIPGNGYIVSTEKRIMNGRFWFAPDTLAAISGGLADCYLEVPRGYDLSIINSDNWTLNSILRPNLIDTALTDVDSNGIYERHCWFNVDTLISLLGETGGICSFEVDYNDVNTFVGLDTLYFFPTGTAKNTSEETTHDFTLFQNYPNPFNSETIIEYQLPERAKVIIKIFDLLGRKVVTILEEEKGKGRFTVTWNAKNENGDDISSGIYLCFIEIHNFKNHYFEVKKLILIR